MRELKRELKRTPKRTKIIWIHLGEIKQVKMFIDLWPILFVPGSLCSERPGQAVPRLLGLKTTN